MVTVDEYSIKGSWNILWPENHNVLLGCVDEGIYVNSVLFLCNGNTNWEAVHNYSSTNRSKPLWHQLIFWGVLFRGVTSKWYFIYIFFFIHFYTFFSFFTRLSKSWESFLPLFGYFLKPWLFFSLFFFKLNLHACHLLGCLFYKINSNWYSVSYMYSALEFLKQFQTFSFQDYVLPLCPIHIHPLRE